MGNFTGNFKLPLYQIKAVLTVSSIILISFFVLTKAPAKDERFLVKITPDEIAQGDAVFVKVSSPDAIKNVKGEWQSKTFPFMMEKDTGTFSSLFGIDMEEVPGDKSLVLLTTDLYGKTYRQPVSFSVLKKEFALQRLTLPSKMVDLSKRTLARVKKEKAIVSQVLNTSIEEALWAKGFSMPLQGEIITHFGVRRILNNQPRSPHSGVDLRANEGTPVRASGDGVVAYVGEHYFSGKSVYLDHGTGIISMYFHLSKIHVKREQKIEQGAVIGRVGQTGRATGPHLHWGIRIKGNRVDPFSLVRLFKPR